jgi:hypothetical protein
MAKRAAGRTVSAATKRTTGPALREEAGEPYANADDVEHPDALTAVVPGEDEALRQTEEAGTLANRRTRASTDRAATPASASSW